ncbi:BspA family leucine-rich repeat surface protein [Lactobacillus panisapium]|uniref:BspA family leucine-rich repeat surface protein n=1 Tax=Lactobacillus panisapium TaxID=2012495 RepID=UPI001C69A4DE|nr:BspA family leucine-rich repeat surface protein [Lactobacillus panisapium]QYN59039.1 BspA family leucine-rich repeat surface protein [Lactobacillus panisapium]
MKNSTKKNGLIMSTTVVGLVCGLALTQQQAKAATVDPANDQSSTIVQAPKGDKATEPNTLPADSDSQQNTDKDEISTANVTNDKPAATSDKDTGSNVSASNEDANKQTAIAKVATTPEVINQGTWGTSKWEYKHEGDDYVLYLHAGTLGESKWINSDFVYNGILQLNSTFKDQLTKIKIDQGVVANQESGGLFYGLSKLTTIEGLSNLDTANVTNMRSMFGECSSLTSLDLSHFVTSKVTDMYGMFDGCSSLTSLDLSHFDTSNVVDMSWMFEGCKSLTSLDLSNFNTSNVKDMSRMFYECNGLTSLDLSHFDTSNVTNLGYMFADCSKLTGLNLSNFNTANVTKMHSLFNDCSSLTNLDLGNFDTSNVVDMSWMFYECNGLTSLDLSHFDTSNVKDMSWMFEGCSSLTSLDLSHFDTSNVKDMSWMFSSCSNLNSLDLSHFDTSNVNKMNSMFYDCVKLGSLDITNFDTSNVIDMRYMFSYCSNLISLDLSHFDTSKVTNMYSMFFYCTGLTGLDLSHFDTSNVTDMSDMFYDCSGLTSLDLSHFDTSNVTDMKCMFTNCSNLTDLDLSNFDTSNVKDMSLMFDYCQSLTSLDLSHFDTSNATDMSWMFYTCINLTSLDISHFDTSNVTDMRYMLCFCNKLNHLVLGSETKFTSDATLPENTNPKIKWVATMGYNQGQKYTSAELMAITDRDQVTTYDWSKEKSLVKSSTESKTITRTINVHQPDGKLKNDRQAATISRKVDLYDDGSTVYGDWSTAQWAAYEVPVFKDYEASIKEIPAQTVTAETKDQTIDVTYGPAKYTATIQYVDKGKVVGTQQITGIAGEKIKPNYQAPAGYEVVCPPATITINKSDKQIINVNVKHQMMKTNELKSITRTINIHKPDGTVQTFNQEAILSRPVTEDLVTGQRTYGSWSNGRWDKIQIPRIKGYTASSTFVPAKTVTATTQAETVDVYYK